jgi:RimJ/RimL family protein N-acetyltransferase
MASKRQRGFKVEGWSPPPHPQDLRLDGAYARLEPLSAEAHAEPLFAAFSGHDAVWDYMPYGPFASADGYRAWIAEVAEGDDPLFCAILNRDSGAWEGVASFLRVAPAAGSIEVGHIAFSPALQRTRAATESMLLMMRWAFRAGYRRYEWKCDALNLASRQAAQRLGFSYEGIFRQAAVVKGRNRDTAWFACIDREWPALERAYTAWLAPENFDPAGRQKVRLGDLTGPIRVASDPALPADV